MYYWIVTEGDNKGLDGGLYKPSEDDKGEKFKVQDSDGNTYGYGTIYGDYEGFEPLDDYFMPSEGATDIFYLNNGAWELL